MDSRRSTPMILLAVLALLAAAAAWYWWTSREVPQPVAPAARPAAAVPASAPASVAPVAAEPVGAPVAANPLGRDELPGALEAFLGHKTLATHFQVDGFARRLVATIDNLGRDHAPASMWPLQPTPGRFTVDAAQDPATIAADNAARYTPLVLLAETIDAERACDLYVRIYPLLQEEYRLLGFPKGEFNQRLLQVIDLLLAAPEPAQPPGVQLVEVKGSVPSTQPWVRYEFVDPRLESLAAGQKILVRVGLVNERRLKKKLVEFRNAVVSRSQAAPVR